MEEPAKRQFDAVSVIWSGLWKNFNERRKYEWRLALGLWTAAAIFVSNFIFKGPPTVQAEWIKWGGLVVAAGAVLLHVLFLNGLNKANRTDRKVMRRDEELLRSLSGAVLSEESRKEIDNWATKRDKSFLGDWASLPTLGITFLFYLLVAFLIASIKVGTSATVAITPNAPTPQSQNTSQTKAP